MVPEVLKGSDLGAPRNHYRDIQQGSPAIPGDAMLEDASTAVVLLTFKSLAGYWPSEIARKLRSSYRLSS